MTLTKKTFFWSSILALPEGISACSSSDSTSSFLLNGAGESFPAKAYTRWFSDLSKSGGPKVNYQGIASGTGRKTFIDQTVDFGTSNDPMQPKDFLKLLVV